MGYEVEEFHLQGSVGISNPAEITEMLRQANLDEQQVDVGLQVSPEGRIWLCVNGMAFLRFKPGMRQMFVNMEGI